MENDDDGDNDDGGDNDKNDYNDGDNNGIYSVVVVFPCCFVSFRLLSVLSDRLIGLVVTASASKAAEPRSSSSSSAFDVMVPLTRSSLP